MSDIDLLNTDLPFRIRPILEGDNEAIAKVVRTVLEEYGVDRPGTVYTDESTDQLYYYFEIDNIPLARPRKSANLAKFLQTPTHLDKKDHF